MVNAVAVLKGENDLSVVVHFSQDSESAPTVIKADLKGLKAGKHGFHIHEFGDNTNGCISAGGHFNPAGKTHGAPTAAERHAGDLGNVEVAADGELTKFETSDSHIKLIGPQSVIGRTVVIHADEDDLGLTAHELSKTTGNAGARLACGVIGITK